MTALLASFAACVSSAWNVPDAAAADVPLSVTISGTPRIGAEVSPRLHGDAGTGVSGADFTWSCGTVTFPDVYVFRPDARCLGSRVGVVVTISYEDGHEVRVVADPTAPVTEVDVRLDQDGMSAVITDGLIEGGVQKTPAGAVLWTTQWFRDGIALPVEAGKGAHDFVSADIGHRLSARVTARQVLTGIVIDSTTLPSEPVGRVEIRASLDGEFDTQPGGDLTLSTRVMSVYPSQPHRPNVRTQWFLDRRPLPQPIDNTHPVSSLELGHTVRVQLDARPTDTTFGYWNDPREVIAQLPGRAYSTTVIAKQHTDRTRDFFFLRSDGSFRLVAADYPGTRPRLYDYHAYGGGWSSMTAITAGGDLSGDSRADLVARRKDGTLLLYRSTGTGTLLAPTVLGTGWNGMNMILAAGDVDADSRGDLIARRASDGALLLYPGTGTGRLGRGKVIGTGFAKALQFVANEDYNGDSRADLYATWPDGTLRLYTANWGGDLARGKIVGTGWSGMVKLLDGGDANADGRSDLYALDRAGALWVYPGDGGAGRFMPRFQLKSELGYALTARLY